MPRLDAILRDVRVAVRSLAKRPAFAVVCILTLALAIGANVVIVGLIDRVQHLEAALQRWITASR